MRRADREITDPFEVVDIIASCDVCRLALADDNVPYIVPMNFGYEYTDGRLILYFHGAKEGKKLDIIAKNPVACFEVDCAHKLIEADRACNHSMEYDSVIGTGEIFLCTDAEQKRRALTLLMKQYAKDKTFPFSDRALDAVTVFRLEVSSFTGKRARTG